MLNVTYSAQFKYGDSSMAKPKIYSFDDLMKYYQNITEKHLLKKREWSFMLEHHVLSKD